MKLRSVRPGVWDIPALDREVDESEVFDVPDPDIARNLLEQADNFAPADDEAQTVLADIETGRQVADEAHAAVPQSAGMRAAELLPLIGSMTADELNTVLTDERAGRNRQTVIAKAETALAAITDTGGNATNQGG